LDRPSDAGKLGKKKGIVYGARCGKKTDASSKNHEKVGESKKKLRILTAGDTKTIQKATPKQYHKSKKSPPERVSITQPQKNIVRIPKEVERGKQGGKIDRWGPWMNGPKFIPHMVVGMGGINPRLTAEVAGKKKKEPTSHGGKPKKKWGIGRRDCGRGTRTP